MLREKSQQNTGENRKSLLVAGLTSLLDWFLSLDYRNFTHFPHRNSSERGEGAAFTKFVAIFLSQSLTLPTFLSHSWRNLDAKEKVRSFSLIHGFSTCQHFSSKTVVKVGFSSPSRTTLCFHWNRGVAPNRDNLVFLSNVIFPVCMWKRERWSPWLCIRWNMCVCAKSHTFLSTE